MKRPPVSTVSSWTSYNTLCRVPIMSKGVLDRIYGGTKRFFVNLQLKIKRAVDNFNAPVMFETTNRE